MQHQLNTKLDIARDVGRRRILHSTSKGVHSHVRRYDASVATHHGSQLKFGSAKTWTIVVEHCESLLPSTLLLDLCAHDRHYNIQLVIVLQVEDVLESEAPKKEIERVREFLHNVIPQADEIVTCGVLPSWTDRMISRLRQSWEQLHGAANSSEPTQA